MRLRHCTRAPTAMPYVTRHTMWQELQHTLAALMQACSSPRTCPFPPINPHISNCTWRCTSLGFQVSNSAGPHKACQGKNAYLLHAVNRTLSQRHGTTQNCFCQASKRWIHTPTLPSRLNLFSPLIMEQKKIATRNKTTHRQTPQRSPHTHTALSPFHVYLVKATRTYLHLP